MSDSGQNMADNQGKWLTLTDAARVLGVNREKLRSDLRRGKVRSEKRDRHWYVWVADKPAADTVDSQAEAGPSGHDDRVGLLLNQVTFLQAEIEARREAERELRVMVVRHTETIDRQSAQLLEMLGQVRALQAGPEPTESPERILHIVDDQDGVDADISPQGVALGRWRRFWRFLAGR